MPPCAGCCRRDYCERSARLRQLHDEEEFFRDLEGHVPGRIHRETPRVPGNFRREWYGRQLDEWRCAGQIEAAQRARHEVVTISASAIRMPWREMTPQQ